MKRTLAIVLLLLEVIVSFAQEPLVTRSTKSYLIADCNPKDTAFLKKNAVKQAWIWAFLY